MSKQEILIMALTRMRGGICTAGFINQPHRESGLCWVRPVKDYGALRLSDMTTAQGQICGLGDVVELKLLEPKPAQPHAEDWLTDFIRHPPVIKRQLRDIRRRDFLEKYIERNPAAVLDRHERSLCLVRLEEVWATFFLDSYSGKYEARMGFRLCQELNNNTNFHQERGLPVTDLKWESLGRQWLRESGEEHLALDHEQLCQRLSAETIYLSLGLSRVFKGKIWPLIIGVHPVPDYEIEVHYCGL